MIRQTTLENLNTLIGHSHVEEVADQWILVDRDNRWSDQLAYRVRPTTQEVQSIRFTDVVDSPSRIVPLAPAGDAAKAQYFLFIPNEEDSSLMIRRIDSPSANRTPLTTSPLGSGEETAVFGDPRDAESILLFVQHNSSPQLFSVKQSTGVPSELTLSQELSSSRVHILEVLGSRLLYHRFLESPSMGITLELRAFDLESTADVLLLAQSGAGARSRMARSGPHFSFEMTFGGNDFLVCTDGTDSGTRTFPVSDLLALSGLGESGMFLLAQRTGQGKIEVRPFNCSAGIAAAHSSSDPFPETDGLVGGLRYHAWEGKSTQ